MSRHYTRIGSSLPTKKSKNSWFTQLATCYQKGYAAFKNGMLLSECPYFNCSHGLQRQRADAWKQGFKRAMDGKPMLDLGD